jgi:hypothetical protein
MEQHGSNMDLTKSRKILRDGKTKGRVKSHWMKMPVETGL